MTAAHQGESEMELVKAALSGDRIARLKLRELMGALADRIVALYAPTPIPREVALIHFDLALESYSNRFHLNLTDLKSAPPYRFTTYFVWWIQQDIENYIASEKVNRR